MTFLAPLYLLGALAAAIPLVLHFLHRQPEARVKFSAVAFLQQAPVEDARRRRLRDYLLLALRVSAVFLVAAAFARPLFSAGLVGSGGVTVVGLDTSMSMSSPARFARAKALAAEAVAKAPAGDVVGVVTFADTAGSVLSPTADRALARAAIDAAAPGYGGTRYRALFRAATPMLAGSGRSTIVVVTDLQASGWDTGDTADVPASTRVAVSDVGAMPPNLAVSRLATEGDSVIATIRNTGGAARKAQVALSVDGRHVADADVAVGADQSAEVTLTSANGGASTRVNDSARTGADGAGNAGVSGAAVAVSVVDPDGLDRDNTRYLALDSVRPAVIVVTTNGDMAREAFYVQQALAAGHLEPQALAAHDVGTAGTARLAAASAVVLASTRGIDAAGRARLGEYVRGGRGLLVTAGPDMDGGVIAAILGDGISVGDEPAGPANPAARYFAPTDLRHPVFRVFGANAASLGRVRVQHAASISGRGCASLASLTSGAAALLDCAVGDGHVLLFASDLDNRGNDFPLHPAFVPFVQTSMAYLAGGQSSAPELLVGDVPVGVAKAPGVVRLPGTSPPRRVAVNVDPRESDPDRLSVDEFEAAVARIKDTAPSGVALERSQQESRQHAWQYTLVLAMAVLALESVVAMRAA